MVAPLLDTAKITADMFHEESNVRKFCALSHLDKARQKILLAIQSNNYLFGNNLVESLRSAKAVSQSVAELRPTSSGSKSKKRSPLRLPLPLLGTRGGLKTRQQQAVPRRPLPPPPPCPSYRPQARQFQQKRKRSVSQRR